MAKFSFVLLLECSCFFTEETHQNVVKAERDNGNDHAMPFHCFGDRKHHYHEQTVNNQKGSN